MAFPLMGRTKTAVPLYIMVVDCLFNLLQFLHGTIRRQYWLEISFLGIDLPVQFLQGGMQNESVVECQGGDGIEGEPLCPGGIVAGLYFLPPDDGIVSNGDDPFTRVTAGLGEGVELPQGNALQPGFFLQFACCALFRAFVHVEEAAGERPASFIRFPAPFYEQDMQFFPVPSQYDAVGRDAWMGVFVTVFQIFSFHIP